MGNFIGRFRLPKRADSYDSELTISSELEPDAASYFQIVIGIQIWMIKLERINIITEVSLLFLHTALSREGHLNATALVIPYVGQKYNSRLAYDPSYPEVDQSIFKKCDWTDLYWDAEEAVQMNAPEHHGKDVDICMFVDSDHIGDKVSHRLRWAS